MIQTHLTVDGGEQWLSWAYGRVRALRALGLPFLTKRWDMGDGSTVTVRLTPEATYIELKGTVGGYVVAVESDADGEVEDSILSDIRERDQEPPYKRADHRYKHYETAYWVGGSSKKPKVSHTTGYYNEYVTDASTPKKWPRAEMLLKVFYHEESQVWVYIEKGTPTGGVGVTLLANNAKTGDLVVIGVLSVTGDAKMTGEDLSWTDASPDGSKVLFVWREVDSMLGFTVKKIVREHSISKWNDAETRLPVVNMTPNDTDVSDVGTGTLDDNSRGTTTGTTKSFFGYGWDGLLRYATEVYTYTHLTDPPGPSAPPGEVWGEGSFPPGRYTSGYAPITKERQIYIDGSLVASAKVVGSGSSYFNAADLGAGGVTISGAGFSDGVGDDIALKYFDARSGAFVLFRRRIEVAQSLVWVRIRPSQFIENDAVLSKSGTLGPVTAELHMGDTKKVWEVTPPSVISTSVSVTIQIVYMGIVDPVADLALAAYARIRFASRKKDEAVFGMQVANKNLFAVVGPAIADKPMFISEDTSGLKTHGKVGLRVTNIYPI